MDTFAEAAMGAVLMSIGILTGWVTCNLAHKNRKRNN